LVCYRRSILQPSEVAVAGDERTDSSIPTPLRIQYRIHQKDAGLFDNGATHRLPTYPYVPSWYALATLQPCFVFLITTTHFRKLYRRGTHCDTTRRCLRLRVRYATFRNTYISYGSCRALRTVVALCLLANLRLPSMYGMLSSRVPAACYRNCDSSLPTSRRHSCHCQTPACSLTYLYTLIRAASLRCRVYLLSVSPEPTSFSLNDAYEHRAVAPSRYGSST